MTLQRLTRDEPASVLSRATLRAKPLMTERLRSVVWREPLPGRDFVPAPPPSYEALIAELARVLASSLEYVGALREMTHVLADRLGCGCVIDVIEPEGPVQIAHVADRAVHVTPEAFAPLVADVVARGRIAAAALDETTLDGRRARAVAERARQETGTPWLVCAPLAVEGGEALGALTIFGGSGGLVPQELARDVAQRAAVAIRNGRLHRAALVAARERQRVLSLVAHELKNPLGVVLMGTVQALDGTQPDSGDLCPRRELEAVHRAARRMKKLVGDLLDLASIDAGKLSVKPSACDVATVIGSAIHDVAPSAAVAGVELIDDSLLELPEAWVDPDRLEQVLLNLISNAVKFTPRGGHVRVRCAPVDRTEIVVAVEDSGRGIEPENLERIFDHFWQAADTASLGSGLGLAICKSIVELSGGRIWAQSTVGVGTTVYFTVPTTAM